MAQIPEVAAKRALVLDANILLRGVLGTRVRALIERYADGLSLITAQSCVEDAKKYLPELCARRRWAVAPALDWSMVRGARIRHWPGLRRDGWGAGFIAGRRSRRDGLKSSE